MMRAIVHALAATCKQAGELFDRCYQKMESSARARSVAQSGYVNGVRQHEYSIQSFAQTAKDFEDELISLLRQLRELSTKGRGMLSDFKFVAGGPNADFRTALQWCVQHGIDSEVVRTIVADEPYVRLDFGLTMASFVEESNRLYVMVTSAQQ